jgi:hypothetical protein
MSWAEVGRCDEKNEPHIHSTALYSVRPDTRGVASVAGSLIYRPTDTEVAEDQEDIHSAAAQ